MGEVGLLEEVGWWHVSPQGMGLMGIKAIGFICLFLQSALTSVWDFLPVLLLTFSDLLFFLLGGGLDHTWK